MRDVSVEGGTQYRGRGFSFREKVGTDVGVGKSGEVYRFTKT